jgi:hypothetical protein
MRTVISAGIGFSSFLQMNRLEPRAGGRDSAGASCRFSIAWAHPPGAGPGLTSPPERVSNSGSGSLYKQVERRLAKIEQILEKRAQFARLPLHVQVDLEAEQELPPEDLLLLQSAKAA